MARRDSIQDAGINCVPEMAGDPLAVTLHYQVPEDSFSGMDVLQDRTLPQQLAEFQKKHPEIKFEVGETWFAQAHECFDVALWQQDGQGTKNAINTVTLKEMAYALRSNGCITDAASKYMRDYGDGIRQSWTKTMVIKKPEIKAASTALQQAVTILTAPTPPAPAPAAAPSPIITGPAVSVRNVLPVPYVSCKLRFNAAPGQSTQPTQSLPIELRLVYQLKTAARGAVPMADYTQMHVDLVRAGRQLNHKNPGVKYDVRISKLYIAGGVIPKFSATIIKETAAGLSLPLTHSDVRMIADELLAEGALRQPDHAALIGLPVTQTITSGGVLGTGGSATGHAGRARTGAGSSGQSASSP